MNKLETSRRAALKGLAALAGSGVATPAIATMHGGEDDWMRVRDAYVPQHPLTNLNNAAVSPPTFATQEAMIGAYRFANENPDFNMWRTLDNALPNIKGKLAALVDCDRAEIALNRNSTEGLCTVIFGMPLKSEDEVLLSDWDYASMRKAWEQRSVRDGIVVAPVRFDLMDSDDAIVDAYVRALRPRAKAMHLTHMMHWNGRVLPVQRLCRVAREHGVRTIVDAAQSFAHIPLSFRQLGCDYLATSLHKWLCAPFGNGMLVMRQALIDETWPLLAPFDPEPLRIEKFDHYNLGTYSSPAQRAIEPAIDFHNGIGVARVHARLSELTRYWVEQASDIKGFKMHTPLNSPETGSLSLFSISGISIETIERRMAEEYRFRVRYRRAYGLEGVRVSPHIYTLKSDLDGFVAALRIIAKTS